MSRHSKDQNEQAPSLVEELADAAVARVRSLYVVEASATREVIRDATRAILSALASKGVDEMPSTEEVVCAWFGDDSPIMRANEGVFCRGQAKRVLDIIRARLAPIFAAKDAERDALRARVAELEARISATGDKQ